MIDLEIRARAAAARGFVVQKSFFGLLFFFVCLFPHCMQVYVLSPCW